MLLEDTLIIYSTLLFVSILASKISGKLGVPTLLFFVLIGLVIGKEGTAIFPQIMNVDIAKKIGIFTLVLILFSGGLDTNFQHVKPIIWSGVLLSTIGVFITASMVAGFLYFSGIGNKLGMNIKEMFLVGTVLAPTDAAAVIPILNSRSHPLKANLGPLLELESGSNDVMVYFLLKLLLIALLGGSDFSIIYSIPFFLQEMVIGILGGIIMGNIMAIIINRINLPYPTIYPILALSLIFITYAATNKLHGSGLLAVYIAGMILGNQDLFHKRSLIQFCNGVGWFMQITMFIALGMLPKPALLFSMKLWGLSLAIFLIFIARPLSVAISLMYSKFNKKHKIFISWVGLRGAVPIVFATYFYQLEVEKAEILFHLVFFVVLFSIFLQGTTFVPMVNWLDLENKVIAAKEKKHILQCANTVRKILVQLEIPSDSPALEHSIMELKLPQTAYIAIIHRGKQYLQPRGDTKIQAKDRLMVMYDTKKELKDLQKSLGIR